MGKWDEHTDRYHPENGVYDGYELSNAQQNRIDIIQQQCDVGYPDEETIRKDTNWMESLLRQSQSAMENERSMGYQNVTLEHDLKKIRKILSKLAEELDRLDP